MCWGVLGKGGGCQVEKNKEMGGQVERSKSLYVEVHALSMN